MKRLLLIIRDGHPQQRSLATPLAPGEQGNLQTLDAMKQIVNEDRIQPDLRSFVLDKIIGDTSGHDPAGEVNKIFDFAQRQIRYQQDPYGVERVADLWSTLYALNPGNGPEGDCGIKSLFIATCCAILGHKPDFVIAKQFQNQRAFNHVYNRVLINGQHKYLDATPEDRPEGWHLANAYQTLIYPIF